MANIYWSEQDVARWYIYSERRGYMAQADTEDDARLIVAALTAMQAQQPADAVPEVLCTRCGQPTMHMGSMCYGCTQAAMLAAKKENGNG